MFFGDIFKNISKELDKEEFVYGKEDYWNYEEDECEDEDDDDD